MKKKREEGKNEWLGEGRESFRWKKIFSEK
jgi:hypothetical protein